MIKSPCQVSIYNGSTRFKGPFGSSFSVLECIIGVHIMVVCAMPSLGPWSVWGGHRESPSIN